MVLGRDKGYGMAISRGKVILCILVAGAAAGCVRMQGRMPDTTALDAGKLVAGVSTKADVLETLGAPTGYGMTRVDYLPEPRVIWSYEAVGVGVGKVRTMMLLVFFKEDRYDGYMWFSSNDKLEVCQ